MRDCLNAEFVPSMHGQGVYFFMRELLFASENAEPCRIKRLAPGELTFENELFIGTGRGTLQVLELQKPGGKMLAVSDFLRGYTLKTVHNWIFPIVSL